jgi:cobalamin synthase
MYTCHFATTRRTDKHDMSARMRCFRKTQIMNIVGAFGSAIVGVALLLNKIQEQPQPLGILVVVVGWSVVLVLVPAATAGALSQAGSATLQRAMLRANWFLMGFWVLCLAISLILIALEQIPVAATLSTVTLSALVYVLPEWVNVRALRSAMASGNATFAGEAKST